MKECSCKVFLTNLGVSRALRKSYKH